MAELVEETLTDEQLDKEIDEKIDGEEVEPSEEPEVEENEEQLEEETEITDDEEDQVVLDLEEETESEEPQEEVEQPEDVEETSEELRFKSQEDAEKSYQNLLKLQQKQATELGEARKKLADKQEPPPTSEEDQFSDLSNDDLAELVITDPAKAVEVMKEQIKRDMQRDRQIETEREKRARMVNESEAAIDEFFNQDEYKNMDDAMKETFFSFIKKHHNTTEAISVKDLTNYHNWMNYDSNVKKAQTNARGKAISDINEASPNVKTLSTAKNAKAKGKPNIKDGMTREQVQGIAEEWDDEELDKRIAALEELPQQ